MGLAVDGANRHDMKLVRATVDSLSVPRPELQSIPKAWVWIKATTLTRCATGVRLHRPYPQLKREAGFKARRWVVERTHGWLNRFRRILVRWDKSPDNYIAFLHFACALIALRAAGLLG